MVVVVDVSCFSNTRTIDILTPPLNGNVGEGRKKKEKLKCTITNTKFECDCMSKLLLQ